MTMLNTPGFASQSPQVQRRLWDIAQEHGWPIDSLIALIEHESGWNPKAKNPNPKYTASGLLQWTKSTAKSMYDLTPAQIRKMPALDQLDLAEQYWAAVDARNPLGELDFLLAGLGVGRCPPGPLEDECIVYPAGSAGAKANPGFQNSEGAITVGNVRNYTANYLSRFAGRERLEVPQVSVGKQKKRPPPVSKPSWAPAIILLGVAGAAYYFLRGTSATTTQESN